MDEYLTAKQKNIILHNPHILGRIAGYSLLSPIHSEWIKYIWNNKKESRSLMGHRGSYKTTAITVIGSIWWMLCNPNDTIGIFRKTFTDASDCVKNISTILKKEEVQMVFQSFHGFKPKALIDRADKLVFNFKDTITREGNVNAQSIKQSATGKHYDVTLYDDFVTIEDKISKAEREHTKIMMEENTNNVLNPNGLACFIGTPWHKDDAWSKCPTPLKFDCYSTGILSEEQIIQKRKNTTNITFAANYELKHVNNDDAIFKNPSFERWDYRIKSGIGHIDKKYWGEDTLAVTFCAKKPNGRYQVYGKVYKENIKYKMSEIGQLHKKYFIGTIHSEDNDDKGFASDLLAKEGIPIETYHESMNKHVKIVTYLLENGFWDLIDFDPDTDPEYLNQILDYVEGSEPDDCPESLCCIGRILLGKDQHYSNRWNYK